MKLLNYVNRSRGERKRLSEQLDVPFILISQWSLGRRQVPAERCPDIERVTGGAVTCEDLRPDVDWSVLRRNAANAEQPATDSLVNA